MGTAASAARRCGDPNARCAAQGVRTEREVHVLQQSGPVHRVLLVRQ